LILSHERLRGSEWWVKKAGEQHSLRSRRAVRERAMRTLLVVVLLPVLNEHLSFFKGGEDLAVQELIFELAVKGFNVAILPGTTRLGN
jgi:hypothetical protein